jgi:hypothetical protein
MVLQSSEIGISRITQCRLWVNDRDRGSLAAPPLPWDSHLARAKWLVEQGYEHLLQGGAPH